MIDRSLDTNEMWIEKEKRFHERHTKKNYTKWMKLKLFSSN